MVPNSIPGTSFCSILCVVVLISGLFGCCLSSNDTSSDNTVILSSFRYPETRLQPFQLRYIRVDLPPWFSSVSITVNSDVNLDVGRIQKLPKSKLAVLCFRAGSPPLSDFSNASLINSVLVPLSNASLEGIESRQNLEQCYPMQKTIAMKLTRDQISPGAWYFGMFNGIGSTRTQSKMIVRESEYSFSANITVEGCAVSTMWGENCNQTIDQLSCGPSNSGGVLGAKLQDQTIGNVFSCGNNFRTSCLGDGETKIYALDLVGVAEKLAITAKDVGVNSTNKIVNASDISLMCFARHDAMPSARLHDYSVNLNKEPLVVYSPKIGRWYFAILPVNLSTELAGVQANNVKVCYLVESQVVECPPGKAGSNCTQQIYILETVVRREAVPFESFFLPANEEPSPASATFAVEPLISNSSSSGEPENSWTFFLLEVPRGAAGGNIHVQLTAEGHIGYEVYARFGGLPSLNSWDYYYANHSSSSDGSMFFSLYSSTDAKIDFYILFVREGTWGFGLRQVNALTLVSKSQTTMTVSLERCPKGCSSHGRCEFAFDASGITSYSFCSCDRTHGGFDCGVEVISARGHLWQSVSLVASNIAAVLPAFLALRKKALAEWVIFTSSGISSALYHACDVGTWCALSFNVLQFMDFWLSFMAVVSTFVYLATIDEAHKRAIHSALAILTALMAVTKATRSSNLFLVIAIGALGLLIGLLIELSTKYRSFSFSFSFPRSLNMHDRWVAVKLRLKGFMKTLCKRFRWGFVLAGFIAFGMAAACWILETSESYWIWHSVWHVSIFTCSFFFLCSKADAAESENVRRETDYELTRQDSREEYH